MPNYVRAYIPGGSFFFTVTLLERRRTLLTDHVDQLREAFRWVKAVRPYTMEAIVILPDHLHCIWTLPDGDADFSTRWRLIKTRFARGIPAGERLSQRRIEKSERGIWQRRFWEHTLRDQQDFNAHVDYIHFNPVKHGYVDKALDWPHSSFSRFVERGMYPANWAASPDTQQQNWE
jgi:putative transposase